MGNFFVKSIVQNRWFDGFVVMGTAALALFLGAQSALAPRDPLAGVAVIFPPWISDADALSRAAEAGAAIVRTGRFAFIVVAIPTGSDYERRVAALGAWFVTDPQLLAGCLEARGA